MNKKQKHFSTSNKITAVIVALALVSGATFFAVRGVSLALADSKAPADSKVEAQRKSPFSFNAAATNGWYKGPANETSLAVFGKNSRSKEVNETYFAYIHYENDSKSEADVLQELLDRSKDYSQYDIIEGETLQTMLQTSDGPIPYELHQYHNKLKGGGSSSQLNDAEVHGYIPYGKGYLLIHGYTTPATLLPEAIEAIKAFNLDTGQLQR